MARPRKHKVQTNGFDWDQRVPPGTIVQIEGFGKKPRNYTTATAPRMRDAVGLALSDDKIGAEKVQEFVQFLVQEGGTFFFKAITE